MATTRHLKIQNLRTEPQNRAIQLALQKGYTKAEAANMMALHNVYGKLVDVRPNFSPF